jgi:signal transduction histidine kinase
VGFSAWWLSGIAIKPLYQAYQQMQQFTADAAHELRTPLAAIQATIDSTLMLPNLSEQETKDTLTTLNRQNKRLSQLVADLLMLSRLDYHLTLNSFLFLRKEPVCIQDIINDLAEELSFLAYNSQITLETEIKVTHSLDIIGDNEKIYRLLFNIVSNAIQYTPEKGKVTIVLEKNQKFAVIIIKDTGIGIDFKEINLIFNRFYRLDKARSRRQGGSGLGLPIAKAIAQGHHGTIEIHSQIDQGTQVIIKLPIDH